MRECRERREEDPEEMTPIVKGCVLHDDPAEDLRSNQTDKRKAKREKKCVMLTQRGESIQECHMLQGG